MGYLGSYSIDDLVTFRVNVKDPATNQAADADSPPSYRIYEDETGTPIVTGTMALLDSANSVGLYSEQISLSAVSGFERGKSYGVYVEGSVSAATVTFLFDLQIEAKVDTSNIASGTSSINTVAEAFTKSGAEPETNTYTDTRQEDGTYHSVEDAAGSTDAYYQFDVGGNGIPVAVTWVGYARANGDNYSIFAYNWSGAAWDQVGSISGSNSTSPRTEAFSLTTAHVGTGANLGKVRWRFQSSDGVEFATDRLLLSYAVVNTSLGFINGEVWVDTLVGEAGTSGNIGTVSRPVSSIADAKIIADANKLKRFHLSPGSSITLAEAFDGYEFSGFDYSVNLNGQSVSGSSFSGGEISGSDDGSNSLKTVYQNCLMKTNTLGLHMLSQCELSDVITLAETGTYDWLFCSSGVAGTGAPGIDHGAAVADTSLNVRHYSGGLEHFNLGALGTDRVTQEGNGQIILDASCAGGVLAVRGHFTITDNAGGVVTVSDDARFDVSQIASPSGVWSSPERTLTQPADQVVAIVSGSDLVVYKGIDWTHSITGLGDVSGYTELWLSIKASVKDTENNALLRISSVNGLERLSKAAPSDSAWGTFTIDDAAAGNVTFTLKAEASILLPILQKGAYDIQAKTAADVINLLSINTIGAEFKKPVRDSS